MSSKEKNKYKCTYCEKTFKYKSEEERHILVHTGEKPYKCYECGSDFTKKSNLNAHLKGLDSLPSIYMFNNGV